MSLIDFLIKCLFNEGSSLNSLRLKFREILNLKEVYKLSALHVDQWKYYREKMNLLTQY